MNSSGEHPAGRARPSFLGIYLNDHLAGAGGGVELFRRAARAHRDDALGPPLEALAKEVAADRESLRALMAALGVPAKRTRMAAGWVAEKAGRLKLNGRLLSRSPLSDVLELEAMRLGVEGKAACWRSLRAVARTDPRIESSHIEELIHRAERQISTLETIRGNRAAQVFTQGARAGSRPA
ncbi:hypothetical protein [Streptomyces sp. NPDC058701]|uniref:hypothetical protein n=1 Tax=Streptomyces sp. NPDC058701 TaxID=3346608 RepID=UPI00365F29AD